MQVGVLHEAQQPGEILARTHGAALHANVLEEQSRELRTGLVAGGGAADGDGAAGTHRPHRMAPCGRPHGLDHRIDLARQPRTGLQRGVRAKFQRFGALVRVTRGDEHFQTGGMGELVPAQLVATALVCVGVVGLGIVEAHEDEDLRRKRQEAANRRYAKSALALLLPIIYCILDAAGTFADSRVLDKLSARALAEGMFATADECSDYAASAANCAYELTFLLVGIVCFVYVVLIRKQKLIARQEAPKYAGAAFETAGQFAYIFALSDTAHVAISAPIISAYCVASVVWSRIFLKEKLSLKHYLMIALVVAGIVILGIYDA